MKKGYLNPRTAPTEHPTIRDIAWAAGIYEGEGHCFGHRVGKGKYALAVVTQKDPWLCERLKALFGGSVYNYAQAKRDYRMNYWKLSGPRGRGFLMTIYAFLSPRRRAQVKEALACA